VAVGDVPEHLCGGTYGRKRKRRRGKAKEDLTYAEKKQRRILKKFGAGGQTLGADYDTKIKLEGGVLKKGKPRVAGSARGRELRAAAALARFEPVKKEDDAVKEEPVSESETEDEYEDADAEDAAIDVDGKKMMDDKGRALVKICEDEDDCDGNAQRELDEFRHLETASSDKSKQNQETGAAPSVKRTQQQSSRSEPKSLSASATVIHLDEIYKRRAEPGVSGSCSEATRNVSMNGSGCSICSLINEPGSVICGACSNVLNPGLVPNSWGCRSTTCRESQYVNSGDAGICGLCGTPRPPPE
jgi:hypothetical protein